MLFHVGALSLDEAGLLSKLDRIRRVRWFNHQPQCLACNGRNSPSIPRGIAQQFHARVIDPIRALATKTIDATAIIGGTLLPGSIGEKVGDISYRKYVFGRRHRYRISQTSRASLSMPRTCNPARCGGL